MAAPIGVTRAGDLYPFHTTRKANSVKRKADAAVRAALYSGSLVRQPCVVCGDAQSEAHHEDHARPLDVTWLCREHHRERDAELRAGARRVMARSARAAAPAFHSSLLADPAAKHLVVETTRAVVAAMRDLGCNEFEMAKRLGLSRQAVNQQLAGGFRSLKTLAAWADAMGLSVRIELVSRPVE